MDKKNCIHKPMLDYEDYYLISEEGDVWSNYTQKYLYLQDNGKGYLMFYACKPGQKKVPKLVHKVVAETFYRRIKRDENGKPLEQVNHRDRCRYHNAASNLQILSIEEHKKFHTGENNGNTGRVVPQEQIERALATREANKAKDPNYYKRPGIKKSKEEIERRKATIEAKKAADPDRYKKTPEMIEKAKQTKIKNGNYRRKHTEEELKRISQSNKGKHFHSQEQKAKTKATREANKAKDPNYYKRERSKESVEKMLQTKRQKKLEDPNYGKNMLGKHHSQETKRKMSEAQKGKPKTKEHIAKIMETKRLKREQKKFKKS